MNGKEDSEDSVVRTGSRAGQVLVIAGLVLVYGVGGYWFVTEIVTDPKSPWWLKIGVPSIVVGITVLFLTALFQRLAAAKNDRYTDVED